MTKAFAPKESSGTLAKAGSRVRTLGRPDKLVRARNNARLGVSGRTTSGCAGCAPAVGVAGCRARAQALASCDASRAPAEPSEPAANGLVARNLLRVLAPRKGAIGAATSPSSQPASSTSLPRLAELNYRKALIAIG